jgi:hypothetical protein
MQRQHWDPLFAWVKEAYGVELALAEGFAPARQSEQTMKIMRGIIEKMDVWELAGELLSYIDEVLHSSPRYKVFDPPHLTSALIPPLSL